MFLTYEQLEKVSRREPPYRGTTDRFPLLNRKHNTKNFYVREEDGQRVFDIAYGHRWYTEKITEEAYLALPAKTRANMVQVVDHEYHMYVQTPNILGTVRPGYDKDGEFEFKARSMGQGDMYFISNAFRGYFSSMSRRGGMVYVVRNEGNTGRTWYPIYKGMKVNARTMKPSTPHEVVIHHVDRKKAKALVKTHDHFFKVSEVMLKALTMDQVIDLAKSMLEAEPENQSQSGLYQRYLSHRNDAPLDAFIWYCMAFNIGRVHYLSGYKGGLRNFYTEYANSNAHRELFTSVKRKIVKDIYREHPDIFKEVRYACGAEFPSCDWGVKVIVNGQEMEQYT